MCSGASPAALIVLKDAIFSYHSLCTFTQEPIKSAIDDSAPIGMQYLPGHKTGVITGQE